MAFIDQHALANNAYFRSRVLIAMVKTAVLVVGEALDSGEEIVHGKRHALGVEIMKTPQLNLDSFAYGVAQNPVISGSSSDGDIEFTVVTIFDDIAGVKISDL